MQAYEDKIMDINFHQPYLTEKIYKNVPEREDPN